MITDVNAFLDWFDGVNRRAVRDVGALPREAESWAPPPAAGEDGWDIGELVCHMAVARVFTARAYCGRGWLPEPWPAPCRTREEWAQALGDSAAEVRRLLQGTPPEWLHRKIQAQDSDRTLSGWRVLMNGAEHDVHHRSQIDTYAGLMGWKVQQIFGITAERAGLVPTRRPRHR